MARIDDNVEQYDYLDQEQPRDILTPPSYKDPDALGLSTYNNKEKNLDKIIRYIPGQRWSVNYYNNVASVNDQVSRASTYASKSLQKYNKIENLTLYLESTLDGSPLGEQEITAIIDADITPFTHDIIIAEMMGGRIAWFEVNKVEWLSYQNHKVFKITIKYVGFKETLLDKFTDIENKVVETYIFDKNFIMEKGSPIITKKDYTIKTNIKRIRYEMLDFYLDNFIDKKTKLLSLFARPVIAENGYEDIDRVYIDPLINNFIFKTTSTTDNTKFLDLKSVDYQHDERLMRTILDCIVNKDEDYNYTSNHTLGWVVPDGPYGRPVNRNIWYMNVDRVVDYIPSDYNTADDHLLNKSIYRTVEEIDYPLSTKYIHDNLYIFSKGFYSNQFNIMSNFEKLLRKFIKREEVNVIELEPYFNHYRKWSRYEQFYIIPILYFMLESFIKNTYSPR